jgi:5,10-methylene-tetrahydrofolate dehydrogenase/methenyl tetrahydrofolate cyclohydrolase
MSFLQIWVERIQMRTFTTKLRKNKMETHLKTCMKSTNTTEMITAIFLPLPSPSYWMQHLEVILISNQDFVSTRKKNVFVVNQPSEWIKPAFVPHESVVVVN